MAYLNFQHLISSYLIHWQPQFLWQTLGPQVGLFVSTAFIGAMSLVTRAAMYLVRLVGKCVWKNTWWVCIMFVVSSHDISQKLGVCLSPKKNERLVLPARNIVLTVLFLEDWEVSKKDLSWNESVVASWWPSNLDNSLFVWLWNVHSFGWLIVLVGAIPPKTKDPETLMKLKNI